MDRPQPNDNLPAPAAHPASGAPRQVREPQVPARLSWPFARFAWAAGGAAVALVGAELLGSAFAASPSAGPSAGPAASSAPQSQTQEPTFTRAVTIGGGGGMSADSNHRMIAVTGMDITGQSVLYLVDTIDKQLAVYQASGGAPGTQSIRLVGARRIDLDLQLEGLNDKTSVDGRNLKYSDLERAFAREVDGSK